MKLKPVNKWQRYRNVPQRSIFAGSLASTFFSTWYWAMSMDEPRILLMALAVATTATAGLLVGLEGALWLVPGFRSSPGRTRASGG
ncbi:hypothetical protein [Candidatus Palauibacter sp.]|uniref:hypothetical protein n=1 Tax=Candidatus Palauibacter sp. TaxID=3101350 RepID=UPI003B01CC15